MIKNTTSVAITHFHHRFTAIEEDAIIAAFQAKKLVSVHTVAQAHEAMFIYTANMQIDERLVIIRTGSGFILDPNEAGQI